MLSDLPAQIINSRHQVCDFATLFSAFPPENANVAISSSSSHFFFFLSRLRENFQVSIRISAADEVSTRWWWQVEKLRLLWGGSQKSRRWICAKIKRENFSIFFAVTLWQWTHLFRSFNLKLHCLNVGLVSAARRWIGRVLCSRWIASGDGEPQPGRAGRC